MLTIETVRAAQANDIDAMGEVVAGTESRITALAYKMGNIADRRDEYMQVGRIAVWEAVSRFSGEDMDSFFAFMHRTIQTKMQDAARFERAAGATGADHDAMKTFAACVAETNGDLDVAEKLCGTLPPAGRRLSAERAGAARLAWEGHVSLDLPTEDGFSLAEILVTDYGVPEELVTPRDIANAERDRKIQMVRAVLDAMGKKRSYVLRATFGIDPACCLGTGEVADKEIADDLDIAASSVKVVRNQAMKSFEKRYRAVTGMGE